MKYWSKCNCGAVTVEIEGVSYSTKNLKMLPPHMQPPEDEKELQKTYYCNYCVNQWGLELCGCGSGELFGECESGEEECQQPMQSIENGYNHVVAKGAW